MGGRKIIEIPISQEHSPKQSPQERASEQAILAAELGTAPEIDLHALSPDEAIRRLDTEISHQAAMRTEVLQIIHGRGAGILREAVRAHLAANPLVAYFRDAEQAGKQGGVTYAALYDASPRPLTKS